MTSDRLAYLVLRIGVAFAFLYPPIDAHFHPDSWIGYFPSFLVGVLPDQILLSLFGLLEVAIAFWILSGKRIFIPSVLATIMLAAIVFFNWSGFEVLFRDVSIGASALALALFARKSN